MGATAHLLLAYQWFITDRMQQHLHVQSCNQSATCQFMHHHSFNAVLLVHWHAACQFLAHNLICLPLLRRLWGMLVFIVLRPFRKVALPVAYRSCHVMQKYAYIFWGLWCTDVPGRGSGAGWPQSTTSSGNASFPSGRASRPKDTSGLSPARHWQST